MSLIDHLLFPDCLWRWDGRDVVSVRSQEQTHFRRLGLEPRVPMWYPLSVLLIRYADFGPPEHSEVSKVTISWPVTVSSAPPPGEAGGFLSLHLERQVPLHYQHHHLERQVTVPKGWELRRHLA